MWFPHRGQSAVVKATGRLIKISAFLDGETIVAEGPLWDAFIGRECVFKLSELKLEWPDFIPPGQRCNATAFRMDAIE
jgi:hypothetical protein